MKDPRNLVIVALIAALAFFAGREAGDGEARAQGHPGSASDSNNRMIAVAGSVGSGVSVLYLIDTVDMQIAVYQSKGGKSIELVAARNIEYDLKIDYFNDESRHSPEQLRKMFMAPGDGGRSGSAGRIRDLDGKRESGGDKVPGPRDDE